MNGKLLRARQAILLLACLALLLGLVSCGGSGGEEGSEASATPSGGSATPAGSATPGGTVEITMWHSEMAANLDSLQKLVRRFNSSQSEVKVKLGYQGTDDEEMTKVVASLHGGELPNIANLAELHTQRLIDSGAIAPVQGFIDEENYDLSDLDKKAVDYYTLDGKLWAMPFVTVVPMLMYNKVTFREVGLDPENPPKDLEEVRQVSEKILQRDTHGNVTRSGIDLDISTGWYLDVILDEHGDLYANNENGRAGRATEALFNGPTGQAFFQWWRDMVKDGLATNVGLNPSGADALFALAAGRTGMCFAGSSVLRSVVDALASGLQGTDVELGVANMPGVPGGSGLPGLFARGLWVFNSHPDKEQEASWKFIKWLMEPEQQAEWYAGSGWVPVSLKALELPAAKEVEEKYPQFKVAVDLYQAAPSTPASLGPLLGPLIDVRQIVARAIEEMLVSDKDPVAAINDAAKEANDLIQEYNRRVQ